MRLHLFRHGIAMARDDPACPEESQRPLTDEGVDKTRAASRGLAALGVAPDLVVTSPYVRARHTGAIAADVLGVPEDHRRELESLVPSADPRTTRKDVWALVTEHAARNGGEPEDVEVLLSGHQPHFSFFSSTLLTGTRDGLVLQLQKASLCSIRFETLADTDLGVLEQLVQPRELRVLGQVTGERASP